MFRFVFMLAAMLASAPVLAGTVSITAPTQVNYTSPASFTVTAVAEATQDGERITSQKLYRDSVLIASSTVTGTYRVLSAPESSLGPGTYRYYSTITTNLGQTLSSAQQAVYVVAPGGNPPTVSMNPVGGGPYIAPATIMLSANAADSDGFITKVDFKANDVAIGSVTAAPYQMTWSNVPVGAHQITATATDNNGIPVTSSAVGVTVGQSKVMGNVESIRLDGSEYKLYGWACSSGRNQSIDVHVYVGGPAGSGAFATSANANVGSEPAVAAACQAQGTAYRFAIPISAALRQQHANKSIHVHGISPIGAVNLVISGSGVLTIPAPLRVTRRYVYDAHQQLCKTIEPETGATVMDYDAAGNLQWSASGLTLPSATSCDTIAGRDSGRKVTRYYDARNRLITLQFPDRNGDQSWTYTPDGLPSQIVTYNDSGTTSVINAYSYNNRRLLTGESSSQPGWYNWGIGYGYDANASLATQSYPTSLLVDYAPNALGQPTRVGSWATNVSYYPNGAIQQFAYGNGLMHTMQQNARQLPSRSTDASVFDFTFRYDRNGNTTNIDDVNQPLYQYTGSRDMTYDGLDRLTYAHLHWWQINNFSYDALDNIRRKDHYNGSTTTVQNYQYDATNRLSFVRNENGAAMAALEYEEQGNLRVKNGQTYRFDFGNRLRAVDNKEAYRYDGHGRRVMAWRPAGVVGPVASTTLSQYSQSGQLVYDEKHTNASKATDYIYLGGSLIATRERDWFGSPAVVRYQHTDALGSPVATTNEAGQVVERTHYEPYGAAINKAVDGVGYTGHVMDAATGLTYMQQRYYDPTLGRFLSVDPVTADSNTGGNFNRYWYADNNPYKFTDPDGRHAQPCKPGSCGAASVEGVVGTDVNSAASLGMSNIPRSWMQQDSFLAQTRFNRNTAMAQGVEQPKYCDGGADCDFNYNQDQFTSGEITMDEFLGRTQTQGEGGAVGAAGAVILVGGKAAIVTAGSPAGRKLIQETVFAGCLVCGLSQGKGLGTVFRRIDTHTRIQRGREAALADKIRKFLEGLP